MKNYKTADFNNSKELAEKLNVLLANYSVFYQNMRGHHWNVRGSHFFELHDKFEEIYKDSLEKIDEIAERILTLGHSPVHKYSDYIERSQITESEKIKNGIEGVRNLIESYVTLLNVEKEILEMADNASDEGTLTLVSDYIQEQEKNLWMFNAFLDQ